jgi:hypothetical protein
MVIIISRPLAELSAQLSAHAGPSLVTKQTAEAWMHTAAPGRGTAYSMHKNDMPQAVDGINRRPLESLPLQVMIPYEKENPRISIKTNLTLKVMLLAWQWGNEATCAPKTWASV